MSDNIVVLTVATNAQSREVAELAVKTATDLGKKVVIIADKGQGFIAFEARPWDDVDTIVNNHRAECLSCGWDPDYILQPATPPLYAERIA